MSIRFEHVSKSFGRRHVLDDVSFEVATGEILFIIGKSGVGKSVTLKHIVGLLQPDSGEVAVDGTRLRSLDAEGLARVRRRCGMVFQHPALLDSLTVRENVAFGLGTPQYRAENPHVTAADIERIVREKLALVHLGPEILGLMPPEISYGMQKRVSLARTLAPGPLYLLFDEPTTGLDPITTNSINGLIFELSRRLKVTSVVVSHDMGCAIKIADRILVLEQGRILSLASVAETASSKLPLIVDFLAEARDFIQAAPPAGGTR